MAYLNKEYTFDKEENIEEFVTAIIKEEEVAQRFINFKPNQKLEKDGDTYSLVFLIPSGEKRLSFQSGETIDEEVRDGLMSKTTFTVDGDTCLQVQDFEDKGTITTKREYTEDSLKVTITCSEWDGEAFRWYKSV